MITMPFNEHRPDALRAQILNDLIESITTLEAIHNLLRDDQLSPNELVRLQRHIARVADDCAVALESTEQ